MLVASVGSNPTVDTTFDRPQCDSIENLEFDHVDPSTKEFAIAGGSRFSSQRSPNLAEATRKGQTKHQIKFRLLL